MLQTLGISLLVGIFGYLFIFVFVDGVLQAPFADSMVHFFEKFGFDNESAIHLYRAIFWDNKTMIISTGFIFLFLCSFYLGMSRFTHARRSRQRRPYQGQSEGTAQADPGERAAQKRSGGLSGP